VKDPVYLWGCIAAVFLGLMQHTCDQDAHADTYFVLTDTRAFASPDTRTLVQCEYKVVVNGEERLYLDGLRWDVTDVELGDSLEVSLRGLFEGYLGWGEYVAAPGNPYVASPAIDPSGDGIWGGMDLLYLRRDGIRTNLLWLRRLWQRRLNDRGVWE